MTRRTSKRDISLDSEVLASHNAILHEEIDRLNVVVAATQKFAQEMQSHRSNIYQQLVDERKAFEQTKIEYDAQICQLKNELHSVRVPTTTNHISIKQEIESNQLREQFEEAQLKLARFETQNLILRAKLLHLTNLDKNFRDLKRKNKTLWKCINEFEKKFQKF